MLGEADGFWALTPGTTRNHAAVRTAIAKGCFDKRILAPLLVRRSRERPILSERHAGNVVPVCWAILRHLNVETDFARRYRATLPPQMTCHTMPRRHLAQRRRLDAV